MKKILICFCSMVLTGSVIAPQCFASINEHKIDKDGKYPSVVIDKAGNEMRRKSAVTELNGDPLIVEYEYTDSEGQKTSVDVSKAGSMEMLSDYAKIVVKVLKGFFRDDSAELEESGK